jgi:DNA-binding MarR family transcriptional regulator
MPGMWQGGPIPAELGRFPGYLMARLGQASSRLFQQALEPTGLHPRDFGVMNIVSQQPGITQQGLHTKAGIDPSSMVSIIDELERLGLAERRRNPEDRRARAIYLTAAGQDTLEELRRVAGKLQREFFGALTAEEQRTLGDLLRKLAAAQTRSGPAASG